MAKKIFAKEEASTSISEVYSKATRRRRRLVLLILLFALYLFALACAWVVFRSPLFRVGRIVIEGNKNISDKDAVFLVQAEMPGNPVWKRLLGFQNMIAWPEAVSEKTLALLPEAKAVSVEKSYRTHTLMIHVEERRPFAVWCASSCFWFDESGVVFRRSMDIEGNLISKVNDHSGRNIGLGSAILPEEFIADLSSVLKAVSESGISFKEIRLNDLNLQEIEVITYGGLSSEALAKEGPKVYFSLRFSADNTAAVLRSLIKEGKFNGLEYVDFRVENRAYYK